jgi:hypothetical protein
MAFLQLGGSPTCWVLRELHRQHSAFACQEQNLPELERREMLAFSTLFLDCDPKSLALVLGPK